MQPINIKTFDPNNNSSVASGPQFDLYSFKIKSYGGKITQNKKMGINSYSIKSFGKSILKGVKLSIKDYRIKNYKADLSQLTKVIRSSPVAAPEAQTYKPIQQSMPISKPVSVSQSVATPAPVTVKPQIKSEESKRTMPAPTPAPIVPTLRPIESPSETIKPTPIPSESVKPKPIAPMQSVFTPAATASTPAPTPLPSEVKPQPIELPSEPAENIPRAIISQFSQANQVSMDVIANILGVLRADVFPIIFDWCQKVRNLRIEGENLVIVQSADMDAFMAAKDDLRRMLRREYR